MGNKKKARRGGLTVSILSLSLLTVMAGAAVAPALNVIREYFKDAPLALVQMIISVPALFIVITNLYFPKLSRKYKAKGLLMVGLVLYTAGGVVAGLFSNIYLVLAARALVGIGVGIVMPMSTGLLAFYYTRDKQDRLMGYSSAMNQLGGSIATLLSGLLAVVSWRASFLVYLMGLLSIVLCLIYLPNERIGGEGRKTPAGAAKVGAASTASDGKEKSVFGTYYPFIIGMFLLMFTFFVYPANFAMETAKAGIIPQQYIAVIMAIMDACGFLGGLAFAPMKRFLKNGTKLAAPVCFIAGYGCLLLSGGLVMTLLGSVLIGFAAGAGVPFLISTASKKAGRNAGSTVLPLISAALYTAQFVTPMILSVIEKAAPVAHIPYITAVVSGILFLLWSFLIREGGHKEQVIQEEK